MKKYEKVSIIILTYNAPMYVKRTLESLNKTEYQNYEVIVFDNNSLNKTKKILRRFKQKGIIDKLILSDENLMFIKGNNEAAKYVSDDSDYIILLNDDIEIRNTKWIQGLLSNHTRGVVGVAQCSTVDNRSDGWCYLVDRDLFMQYKLDDRKYKVYFSVADLTARLVNDGYSAKTIKNYKNFIYHFGSASGPFKVKGKDAEEFDKIAWRGKCELIEHIKLNPQNTIKLSKIFYIYDFVKKVMKKTKKSLVKLVLVTKKSSKIGS